MKAFIISITVLSIAVFLITCERADMYELADFGPEPDDAYLFTDPITDYTGDMRSQGGPDTICRNIYSESFSFLEKTRVRAFLSTSEFNVKDIIPKEYADIPVYGVKPDKTEAIISTSWAELWDGNIDDYLSVAAGVASTWMSGSTSSGIKTAYTCNDWTDTAEQATYGSPSDLSSLWIDDGNNTCSSTYDIVCIAY